MRLNWRPMIGVLVAILTLRVVGFIPNTWLMLGFIVFVWLWAYVLQNVASQTRLINWGFGITLAMALMTTVGYNLYSSHVAPYTLASRAAAERARLNIDLGTALRINPQMLISRAAINNHIQWLQDKISDQQAIRLKAIDSQVTAGAITPEAAWKEISKIVDETKGHQQTVKALTDRLKDGKELVVKDTQAKKSDGFTSWPWRMVALGAILLAAMMLIPAKIVLPGRKFIGWVGAMVLIAGLALVFFPEAQAKLTSSDSGSGGEKQIAAHHATKASATAQLPANAKFVKALAPGEIAMLTRASLELPPPERWTRGPNGVVREPDWPSGAKSRGLRNTTKDRLDLFVVMVLGQNVESSTAGSTLGKQVTQASTAQRADDCLLDKAFGPK